MKFTTRLVAGAVSTVLAAAGMVALATVPASATSGDEVCTPSDAWTETIEVPAVGEPTITVTNPDYKPAIPAVTTVVTHPAETKNVEHAAEGYTEYHFAKFTRERTRTFSIYGWSAWTDYGPWTKYSPETHTSWEQNTNPLGSPQWHSAGDRNWGTVQWERQWQAQYDGQSRFHETKAAWVEVVVTKPAWDETVIVTPEVPAVGTETIEVPNPDYKPASSYPVEHPAVACPPVVTPPTEEPPVVNPPVVATPAPAQPAAVAKAAKVTASDDTLAQTGAESNPWTWALGSLAVALGLASMIFAGARRATIRNSQE